MNKKHYLILFFLILCFLLYPFESVVIPEWKVEITNQNDKPFANRKIYQIWGTAGEAISHNWKEESLLTDNEGFVVFPARKMRASVLRRIFGGNVYTSTLFPPISFVFYSSVSIGCQESKNSYSVDYKSYEGNNDLPQKLVVPLDNCTPNL